MTLYILQVQKHDCLNEMYARYEKLIRWLPFLYQLHKTTAHCVCIKAKCEKYNCQYVLFFSKPSSQTIISCLILFSVSVIDINYASVVSSQACSMSVCLNLLGNYR